MGLCLLSTISQSTSCTRCTPAPPCSTSPALRSARSPAAAPRSSPGPAAGAGPGQSEVSIVMAASQSQDSITCCGPEQQQARQQSTTHTTAATSWAAPSPIWSREEGIVGINNILSSIKIFSAYFQLVDDARSAGSQTLSGRAAEGLVCFIDCLYLHDLALLDVVLYLLR